MAIPTKATSTVPSRKPQHVLRRKSRWLTAESSSPVKHPADADDGNRKRSETIGSENSPTPEGRRSRSGSSLPASPGDQTRDDPASSALCTSIGQALVPSTPYRRVLGVRHPLRIRSPKTDPPSGEQKHAAKLLVDDSPSKATARRVSSGSVNLSLDTAEGHAPLDTPAPGVASPAEAESLPQPATINMGQLVPVDDVKGKSREIPLYLPDDGRETILLRVGRQEGCQIRIHGEGIGRVHCYIKLSISLSRDCYTCSASLKPIDDCVTTVNQSGSASPSSSNELLLTPGCQVVFGTCPKHRYLYVGPEDPAPTPWLPREFIWSPDTKADFGGPQSNSIVYLLTKRGPIASRHALKIISMVNFKAYPQLERMADREMTILRVLRHENIMELQAFRRDELQEQIIFIFPEMVGGSLHDCVRNNRFPVQQERLCNKLAPSVAKQMLGALKHLHELDIVHRDIKPENILLAEEWSVDMEDPPKIVLGDFGISRYTREPRNELFTGGTLDWTAPRSFRRHTVPDHKMDLWGLGLVIWFIIAGSPRPWGEFGYQEEDESDQLDWPRLTDLDVTKDCKDFVKGFLVRDPQHCRSIKDSQEHLWIEHGHTVDWSVIEGAVFDARGVELTAICTRWDLFVD